MAVSPGARFSKPAELYDLIYDWKDYAGDAERVRELLHEAGIADGARVLEAACGTASYLAPLAEHFEIAGFDLDDEMLAVARRKLPGGRFFRADLADFEVDEPFDAVLVLFGGVGYVAPGALAGCARSIAGALVDGGVALVEPWLGEAEFEPHTPHMLTVDTPFLKVARQCIPRREGDRAILDFHWLIARPGFEVEHVVEPNHLWLHEPDDVAAAFEAAGFAVERLDEGFMQEQRLLRCTRG